MTRVGPAMSGKSPSICCTLDSREAVDLPRIHTHHDLGSTALDKEAKNREGSDPAWGQPRDNGDHAQKQGSSVILGKFLHASVCRMGAVNEGSPLAFVSCALPGAFTGRGRELGHGRT